MKSTTEEGELWHWEGRVYRLVDPQLASYPVYEKRKVDGHMQTVKVGVVEYTHVRAGLVGDDYCKTL